MLLNALKIYSDYWRFPQVRDYLRMGYGIEVRYKRCRPFWEKHLKLCQSFQSRTLEGASDLNLKSLAVLGAGRLYDLALPEVLGRFERIDLFDIDPSVKNSWQRLVKLAKPKQQVNFHFCDLSGSIQAWSNELRLFLSTQRKVDLMAASSFFQNLSLRDAPDLSSFDCIFSLNLFSQISIYWRDRVFSYFADFWNLDSDAHGRFAPELQNALESSQRKLEEQHLQSLAASKASVITLISDRFFYYYQKDKTEWQVEPALQLGSEVRLTGYNKSAADSWLWHIAPQDVEQAGYGIIHEVFAEEFRSLSTC